jgi:hypothetical protein
VRVRNALHAAFLKEQVAEFYEVAPQAIGNHLSANESELRENGYEVLQGKGLQELKLALKAMDVDETDFVNITATPQRGIQLSNILESYHVDYRKRASKF